MSPTMQSTCMRFIRALCAALLCAVTLPVDVQAEDQHFAVWSEVAVQGSFPSRKQLKYIASDELRIFVHNDGARKEDLLTAGLGYQHTTYVSFWAGVQGIFERWRNQGNDTAVFWQEVIAQVPSVKYMDLFIKTRLEERTRRHCPEWGFRVRPRISLFFPGEQKTIPIPFVADELFINLNKTCWNHCRVFDKNWLVIGCLFPLKPYLVLTASYINDYRVRLPENQVNHVIAFSLEWVF